MILICHSTPKFIAQIVPIVLPQWIWSLKNQPLLKTQISESREGFVEELKELQGTMQPLFQTFQLCNPHNLPLLKQICQDDLVVCRGTKLELSWVINSIASINSLLLHMPLLTSEINSPVRINMPSSPNSIRSYLL